MQVDISFEFAKVFNIDKLVHVAKGQQFSIFTDSTDKVNFFSNNDATLAINASDNAADITATGLGESILLIMDANFTIVKTLIFLVLDSIQEPATSLNTSTENLPK
jgi:hypothetical protein